MMQTHLFDSDFIVRDALISTCGLYRYMLSRVWDVSLPRVCFCALNPSKADAFQDDPTIRRLMKWARNDWGCGSLVVVNAFAFRSSQPSDLLSAADPVGPDNFSHVAAEMERAKLRVVGWGIPHKRLRRTIADVLDLLRGYDLRCLEMTAGGFPIHPSPRNTQLTGALIRYGRRT